MGRILFLCLLLSASSLTAQTRLKWNAPATLVLVPHLGMETTLGEKWTYQADVAASFWERFRGASAKAVWLSNELRFYPKESFKGFYAGPNLGLIRGFKIRKPGKKKIAYQEGYSIMMGASAGYVFDLNDNLSIDLNLGGGFGQGFYKHYYHTTGKRYDRPEGAPYNKTGEWWPIYRGGVMLSFKL